MKKGEFSDYELLVEQSDTKGGITVSLWMKYNAFLKTQNVKYEVDLHDIAKISDPYHGYKKLPSPTNEAQALKYYEDYCKKNGFNPYP